MRPLPWIDALPSAFTVVRQLLLGVLLYVLPLAVLTPLLRRRRWSLAGFMALPVVVGGALTLLLRLTPRGLSMSQFLGELFVEGLAGAVILAFVLPLAWWTLSGQWGKALALAAAHLVVVTCFVAIELAPANQPMEPWIRYDWADSYTALLIPIPITGFFFALLVLSAGLRRGLAHVRSAVTRRRATAA